jgi:hypothetical protein
MGQTYVGTKDPKAVKKVAGERAKPAKPVKKKKTAKK